MIKEDSVQWYVSMVKTTVPSEDCRRSSVAIVLSENHIIDIIKRNDQIRSFYSVSFTSI